MRGLRDGTGGGGVGRGSKDGMTADCLSNEI